MKQIKVMFVCMGNICRSPTAHGVFQQLVNSANLPESIIVSSSGTINYHVGGHPDPRSMAMAKSRGVDLSHQIAQQIQTDDFHTQDYILAMDYENMGNLQAICPTGLEDKIALLLSYHPDEKLNEVPDPYYGGGDGFKNVYEMIEEACIHLLATIKKSY